MMIQRVVFPYQVLKYKKYKREQKAVLKTTIRRLEFKNKLFRDIRSQVESPQRGGRCGRAFVVSPKKPNSAKRKVIRVHTSNHFTVDCHIPGSGDNHNLQINSKVLIYPASVPDLPGINYRILRGCRDCFGDLARLRSRSRYGTRRPQVGLTNIKSSTQKK